jgi:hypothetical protein
MARQKTSAKTRPTRRNKTTPDAGRDGQPTTSFIPAGIRDAAAAAQDAKDKKRRDLQERADQEQHLTDAVKAFRDATEALWLAAARGSTEEQTRTLMPPVRASLLEVVQALAEVNRVDGWAKIDRERTYADRCVRNGREMTEPSFEWACRLFDQAKDNDPPSEQALAETWQARGLRDTFRWLSIFVHSLAGEGPPLPKALPPGKNRPCYERDHLWLRWADKEGLTAAQIRDRWNGGHPEQPLNGRSGWNVVREGLRKARAEKNFG